MNIPPTVWQAILSATIGHPAWHERLRAWREGRSTATLHLAMLREPYLGRILAGRKRIESRFGRDRRAPFGQVKAGDLVLLKRASGPLAGLALVTHTISREITLSVINELRTVYAADLAIDDPQFWELHACDRYVTLIWIDDIYPLPAIALPRRDRRGWVVVG
ncbi:ASCH domain-containing protein [uncultured Chloroflexus sp.]|uniref:ASCH domain-containing protein n=1 Tax=uncultured Chloroflexus sp. TaxID=214040 RepID=UPI0026381D9D|nr:ASCH domain-containing protein [uncultured Chloroflexus sp.]